MLDENLAIFYENSRLKQMGASAVDAIDDKAFVLRPPASIPRGNSRDVDLVFMALNHGNEYGGLPVVNAVCDYIRKGTISPRIAIGFILGNVDAAINGRRFIERDMNRSFNRGVAETVEDRRAREVEKLLKRTQYFVDLHQTIEPSELPFFVFTYQESSLRFAQAIAPNLPVVTHWGRPFSSADDSFTSDEFVNRCGGVGLSIELGQKGFGVYQIAAGIKVCLDAITAVTAALADGAEFPLVGEAANPIYTWGDVVPYPAGRVVLDGGLTNFQPIRQGQRLGLHEGKPILAAKAGLMLFPKYVRSESEPRPAELYRLLRRPSLSELGRGDCLVPAQ
ncbi:MAG TPA: succinylglutamate desuccinylase/aspartoacylase family protein [Stellaceae bacterium]